MKKIRRKFLPLFLAAVMVFSVIPFGMLTASAETSGDFSYSVISEEEKTCEITRYKGSATELDIPAQLDGYTVTSIGNSSLAYCTSLTNVTIPDTVTSIDGYAFYCCTSLTSVNIPDRVTSIEITAFAYCTSLTNIDVSANNPNYSSENGVLFNKSKTDLLLYPKVGTAKTYSVPDNVTSIGAMAFAYCRSLTSVEITNSVTNIGPGAFGECTSLTSIEIPNNVTSIGDQVFYGCTSLTNVTIPDSVTSIGRYAFGECTSLTSIEIPNNVTSIGDQVFYGCTSLTSVIIPDSVTSIGGYAFERCTSLANIDVSANNPNYSSENGVLFNKSKTQLLQYPAGKTDETYSVPDSVTSIGGSAFSDCTSLTSVNIPDSVTSIDWEAFKGCTSLASITIPSSVISIGGYAFGGCTSLTNVNIPDSVTSIGYSAFNDCTSLANIDVSANNPNYFSENGVLFNKSKTELLRYPIGKNDKTYSVPDSVTTIGEVAFCGCTSLASVTIPNSVTIIGTWGFDDCDNLTIYGYSDSYAETYANENSIPFTALDAVNNSESGITVIFPQEDISESNIVLNTEIISTTEESVVFDISLTENGTPVQPANAVTVKIPVPDTMSGVNCRVYREEDDGTSTDMNAVYKNGYMVFTTDHFSIYRLENEPSIVQYSKSQIRFRGVGADKDFSNYKGEFDIRTVAKISQEDFIKAFGTEEEALKNISDIGFVYAAQKNVETFDIVTARAVVEGTGTDENYIKKPVTYIQHAGDGEDYIFTCLITGIADADREQAGYCYAYVCCNGEYYYFDNVAVMDFNSLYTVHMPKA